MKQPTYFIEIWNLPFGGGMVTGFITKYNMLRNSIDATKFIHGETIAIWKIYPKNKEA